MKTLSQLLSLWINCEARFRPSNSGHRQGEREGAAVVELAFRPDRSAVALNQAPLFPSATFLATKCPGKLSRAKSFCSAPPPWEPTTCAQPPSTLSIPASQSMPQSSTTSSPSDSSPNRTGPRFMTYLLAVIVPGSLMGFVLPRLRAVQGFFSCCCCSPCRYR